MGRSIVFVSGEFYHVYNRGTDKRDVFLDESDYNRFITLLYVANGTVPVDLKLQGRTLYDVRNIARGNELVNICGYALMPNHYHLLLQANVDAGVSDFMRKLGTAYTMYFNTKNERSGNLFQGKFKATHVNDDQYLQYLLSYIHLNPVALIEPNWKETGIKNRQQANQFLSQYKYSSYPDYLEINRIESIVLNQGALPTNLSDATDFKSAVEFWLQDLQGRTL